MLQKQVLAWCWNPTPLKPNLPWYTSLSFVTPAMRSVGSSPLHRAASGLLASRSRVAVSDGANMPLRARLLLQRLAAAKLHDDIRTVEPHEAALAKHVVGNTGSYITNSAASAMSPPTMPIICPSLLELFLWWWPLARPRTACLLLLMMLTPRCKGRRVRHTPFLLQLTITMRSNPAVAGSR